MLLWESAREGYAPASVGIDVQVGPTSILVL